MVDDKLKYRAAFAANNVGVEMLRKGLLAEALPIFRRAASLIRLESPIRSLFESNSEVRRHSAMDRLGTVIPFEPVHLSSHNPAIHCMEEEDLESIVELLNVSELTNMVAINVREIPLADDHCTMEFQAALIIYNYALASLLCYYYHGGDHKPASSNRESLLIASKALFGLAREIMFRRIRHDNEHGNVCLSAKSLHLTSLVLSGLSEISRWQNDVQSTLRFMDCQLVLECYFEEAVAFGGCTNSISAAAA
jgi:hypothetical protein